ncbi:MAG: hypothetical protein ACH34U_13620 [Cyanobium sp.]|jgi:hypothetical protein
MRIGLAGVGRFGQLHAAVLTQMHRAAELFSDAELEAFVIVTPDEQPCCRRRWRGGASGSWCGCGRKGARRWGEIPVEGEWVYA